MNANQCQYLEAYYKVQTLEAFIEGKLSRVNLNGLSGRAYRKAAREARLHLSDKLGLLTAQKNLVDAENALIEWGMQVSGITLEEECLLDSTFRKRIIRDTLRVNVV